MRTTLSLVAALAAFSLVSPVSAQDNLVTLGVFVTVRAENVPNFEEAAREHAQWHASQGDTQAWPAYQALTGRGEYAILAPNMTWASMDNPPVDMSTDIAMWARSGAQHVETEEVSMWTNLPGGNPPADPTQYPIVQVFEFEIQPGGQAAVMEGIQRFDEAMAGADARWGWSTIISADAPPAVFVAVWAESFAALGAPSPAPEMIMTEAYGPGRANLIMNAFAEATVSRASQIWMLRPDLSYFPG